jgi:ribonuclease-3
LNEQVKATQYRGLDYQFKEESLLWKALTHSSAGKNNNERLEFLGDALLGFIIAEELYRRFPLADEGQLTRLRASLVKKETLAELARQLELGKYLILGEGERKSGGWHRDSILANTFEALVGAIYLDGGLDACYSQVLQVFASLLEATFPETVEKDPKTQLQEWLQARKHVLPHYEIIAVEGEPHKQIFTVKCECPGIEEPVVAQGNSRRRAEQLAASLAMEILTSAKLSS